MSAKILFVDNDSNILDAYKRGLRQRFSIDTALGGSAALELMDKNGPYGVVVADMQMPGMNGVEFLVQAQQRAPDTVRLMVTGNSDQATAVEAMNKGHVYQFLNKPCPAEMLVLTLGNALKQHQLITAERELLEKTLNGSIKMLTEILGSVEPRSFGRGEKLREWMQALTKSSKTPQSWELDLVAMLSQIGYVTVPPELLEKVRAGQELSETEKDLLTRIPEIGANLLANIPRLESVANIVRYQANFDGSGFPRDSISGEAIPLGARILKVLSDLADLEISGLSKPQALEQMQNQKGRFDHRVLDAAFASFDVYLSVPSSEKPPSKPIRLKQLEVGQILTSGVETRNGVLIVGAGTKISGVVLEKLRNFGQLEGVNEPIYVQC